MHVRFNEIFLQFSYHYKMVCEKEEEAWIKVINALLERISTKTKACKEICDQARPQNWLGTTGEFSGLMSVRLWNSKDGGS